ncbi:MAG: hypothetical protein O2954_20325, partial [bacterium]|nr:hypothetical protein [bacterium]
MNLLGLSICHDAHAVIVQNGKLIAAVGEERLNRVKMYYGFPFQAINTVLELSGLQGAEIDAVCIGSTSTRNLPPFLLGIFTDRNRLHFDGSNHYTPADRWKYFKSTASSIAAQKLGFAQNGHAEHADNRFASILSEYDISAPRFYYDHHYCHCASAYYTSGAESALSLSMDGGGDGLYAAAYKFENGVPTRISHSPGNGARPEYSPADVYSFVTKYMGFKRVQHEGKVTGLAAHGDPARLYSHFEKFTYLDEETLSFRSQIPYDPFREKFLRCLRTGIPYDTGMLEIFEQVFHNETREDIAAALQKRCEDLAQQWTQRLLEQYPSSSVLLSGGLFANVRINQVVSEIDGVENIYVHPCMGDGGLAAGACLIHHAEKLRTRQETFLGEQIHNVYLGPGYSNTQIETALSATGINFHKSESVATEVATLLEQGNVIGHFNGRMEYGPRALGNRSILYRPDNRQINDWLNKRLRRTEFMPFAPICMQEHAADIFENFHRGEIAAQFMTVTFNVKPAWRKRLAGVCHIDNTARPQTVTPQQNPQAYAILNEFYKQTGIPVLINTSFNIHGEPIVCSPEDAIRSFQADACDILVLGPYVCKK